MAGKKKDNKILWSWERQPKESVQAYEAFYLYLRMGEKRTLRKVEQELNKSHALIGRWSSVWNWVERSRDYDNQKRREEFDEACREQRKMQNRQIQTAMLMQKKALEALREVDIEGLTPNAILRLIKEGARLESDTRKASLQHYEVKEQEVEKAEKLSLSNLTDEELRKLIAMGGDNNGDDV